MHRTSPNLQGQAYLSQGNPEAAVRRLELSREQDPGNSAIAQQLGEALHASGRFEECFQALAPLASGAKTSVPLLRLLASASLRTGRFDSVLGYSQALCAREPHDAQAWHWQACAQLELGEPHGALQALEHARRLAPRSAEILNDMALACTLLGRNAEALRHLEEAIAYRPADQQDFHRLTLLIEAGRDAEVIDLAGSLLARHPGRHDVRALLGWARIWSGQGEAGLQTIEDAYRASPPGDTSVRMHCAFANLLLGRFARGWELNEGRFTGNPLAAGRRTAVPDWRGLGDLTGKTLLLYPEQGVGDLLQFCRYVLLLQERGAHIVLEAPADLHGLLASLEPSLQLALPGSVVPADWQCPIMSLPYALQTRLDSIPAQACYLTAAPEAIARWRARLGSTTRPRIGLAFSGNPRHAADRRRSMNLEQLLPIFGADLEFHLLQPTLRSHDVPVMERLALVDHRPHLHDFSDTAALIACMDLVISVDTSVAHLAGALGVPAWVLLARPSEWRWLLERRDTPWYPGMRLYRMQSRGDWSGVVSELAADLAALAARPGLGHARVVAP